MGLVKSSSKAGSFQAQPRPWWSEKAPCPLDPGFLCNGGRTEQCLEFTGSVTGTCSRGPARSKIRTKWQEPQVCPWLPGCRQRKNSSLSLWVPYPIVTGPRSPRAALCPLGPSCPDLPSSALSWASPWRCQVSTLVFPAWRPAQLPGDILSPWLRAQALPLARSAPAVWVPSRSPGGAQEPREFREVGKDTQILSAADRERCPRHLTPGLWPDSGQTHRRGSLPHCRPCG